MDEKQALKQLLELFYVTEGSLEWSVIEGTTVAQAGGDELSEYLLKIKESNAIDGLVGLNDTNSKCEHYNWGDGYPSAYGARCKKFNKFFSKDKNGRLEPNCFECMKHNA